MEDVKQLINGLRHEFAKQSLGKESVEEQPIAQFEKWFKEALESKGILPVQGVTWKSGGVWVEKDLEGQNGIRPVNKVTERREGTQGGGGLERSGEGH